MFYSLNSLHFSLPQCDLLMAIFNWKCPALFIFNVTDNTNTISNAALNENAKWCYLLLINYDYSFSNILIPNSELSGRTLHFLVFSLFYDISLLNFLLCTTCFCWNIFISLNSILLCSFFLTQVPSAILFISIIYFFSNS